MRFEADVDSGAKRAGDARAGGARAGGVARGSTPRVPPAEAGPSAEVGEYRIDELARLSGTTVRNVRAYQDRGLLPPSRREGRVALYSDAHLARLKVITQLLDRGYTLASIGDLLAAWESGQNVGDLLGLEAVLAAPWSHEMPTRVTAEELAEMFGAEPASDPEVIELALELGFIELAHEPGAGSTVDSFVVRQPRMLHVGAELVGAGVPLRAVLALGARLQEDVDRVARSFVELAAEHVFDPVGEPIPVEEVPRLAEVVRRLRPLAREALDAELAEAMERHVQAELRGRLDRMIEGLEQSRRPHTEAS